jgi:site-specific recombinase XerD
MDALLAAPDRHTSQGQRDYALLLFLYNSGARADEQPSCSFVTYGPLPYLCGSSEKAAKSGSVPCGPQPWKPSLLSS